MTDDNAGEAPSFSDAVIKLEITLRGPSKTTAFDAVIAAVDAVFRGLWQAGLAESGVAKSAIDHLYTRLARCLTAFITDPEARLNIAQ